MSPPRLLGVFAHPDDEVFCAGGSLARYADAGAVCLVVSATTGQAGQIRSGGHANRTTLGQVRAKELETACAILGASARCLDYFDGTLSEVDPTALRADISRLLEEFDPDVVITFGDDGAYGHPDHITISRATSDAFAHTFGTNGLRRLYHSHFPRSRLLLLDRLSRWLVEMGERFRGQSDFVAMLSLFAEESTTMRYASDHVETTWAPAGTYVVEQGEQATSLYLILSGEADAVTEHADGTVETLSHLGPGQFFGELGVVSHDSMRTASVVATEPLTCLVFSAAAPTLFEGRGVDARLVSSAGDDEGAGSAADAVIDVSDWVERKIAAIAAHRTQFPIDPDLFPPSLLRDMFAKEYFVRVFPPMPPETDLLP